MNYLAHAYQHLDQPFFAAGTALPDWMSVIDRKNRARRQYAEPLIDDSDADVAAFARGVLQHHVDDQWFHENPVFVSLSTAFAVELRQELEAGLGHQAGFLGHISVELLLDSVLIERHPDMLERYYAMLAALDANRIQLAANRILRRPVSHLVMLIPRFVDERFLADYPDDHRLLRRLNGVMRRVRLPSLPESLTDWLQSARPRVRHAADELLSPHV